MMNIVIVHGTLLDRPRRRTLADGRDLVVGTILTTEAEGERTSVPFSWFGAPERAERIDASAEVIGVGRIDRRFFRSGGRTESLTDLVVTDLHPARHRRRAERALRTALDPVRGFLVE